MSAPARYRFPSGLLAVPISAGAPLLRIHETTRSPVWFGPAPGTLPRYRFDAPTGEFRTLYCARNLTGAFAETMFRRATRVLSRSFVEARAWSIIAPNRILRVAKLYDEGLVRHGVTADICAGDDYAESRRFARDLFTKFPDVDGIAYRARHNNGQICYALFDRIDPSEWQTLSRNPFADEMRVAEKIMRQHGAIWDLGTAIPPP